MLLHTTFHMTEFLIVEVNQRMVWVFFSKFMLKQLGVMRFYNLVYLLVMYYTVAFTSCL